MARRKQTEDDEMSYVEQQVKHLRQIIHYSRTQPSYEIDEETGERWVTPDLEDVLVLTMRFVLTMRGAPKDCRNPACSKSGCQLRIEENGDGVCPGGMTLQDIDTAVLMLAYLIHIGKRYAPWAFASPDKK